MQCIAVQIHLAFNAMNKKVLHTVIDKISDDRDLAPAIQCGDELLSYKKLKEYSNSIGHALIAAGLNISQPVGVYLNSGIAYVPAIIGVNKAGGIFMPLERNYPEKRLIYLLETVSPPIIITDNAGLEKLLVLIEDSTYSVFLKTILVIECNSVRLAINPYKQVSGYEPSGEYSVAEVPVEVNGDWGNYLLYTSGSTGLPKIIEGCHKGLSHFIHWEVAEFDLNNTSRISQLVPLSFDVSLRDIFTPLLAGGTLCIPDECIKGNPVKLIEWMGNAKLTLIHTVPSLFRLITKELEDKPGLLPNIMPLKYILLSGEALYGKDVLAWRKAAGVNTTLVNLYGPTETTLAKLYNRINDEIKDPAGIVPLGIPLPNTSIIICEKNELCQVGAIGELYIKTPFRSKGYYQNAELTSVSFIQNPLHNDYEDIVYRTGDLGKYLPNRSVAFIGRQDSQVKIRGNRVELSETERIMYGYPGMEQVVVVAIKRVDESDVLASYYVASAPVELETLRNYLKAYLPDYMHPSYFIALDEFPLNLNGKINKKALPRPEDLLYEKISYEAPANKYEEQLAEIWSSVLGLNKVGVNNSFFDLGGHSLTATKSVSRIYKELGIEISLKDFFDHATIRSMARFLSLKLPSNAYHSIPLLPEKEYYALSYAQKMIWVLDQSINGMVAYNMPGSCLLNWSIDKKAFSKAFETLISRHETLRTTFLVVEGEPCQKIHSEINFSIQEEDISSLITDDITKTKLISDYAQKEFNKPFDLIKGPLLRARLVKLAENEHLFLFTMHHIIGDGWSIGLLAKEIFQLYTAYCNNDENPLLPLPVQYKDYAAWHNELLESEQIRSYQKYWHTKLSDELPMLNLPLDYTRENTRSYAGDKVKNSLNYDLSNQIRQLCSEQDVSLFMFFLTIINILLYKQTGQRDIITGTTIVNRNNTEVEDLIGLFLGSVALRNKLNMKDDFITCLHNVKQTVLEAYEYQAYPVELLLADLNIEKIENRNPLYDVLVVLNNSGLANAYESVNEGLKLGDVNTNESISKFDLTFFISEDQEIGITLEYSTELFKRQTIEKISTEMISLIELVIPESNITLNTILWRLSGKNLNPVSINTNKLINEEF